MHAAMSKASYSATMTLAAHNNHHDMRAVQCSVTMTMVSSLLAHISASFDALSYIIAMGIVDMMTFGRPVFVERATSPPSPSSPVHGEDRRPAGWWHASNGRLQSSYSGIYTQRSSSSSSFGLPRPPRRAASDPGWDTASQPHIHARDNATTKDIDASPRKTTSPISTSFYSRPWERRTGSMDSHASSSYDGHGSSSNITLQRSPTRSHRPKQDGALHHYQRKILARQIQRTAQLQPYVRVAIILLFAASWLALMVLLSAMLVLGVRPSLRIASSCLARPFMPLLQQIVSVAQAVTGLMAPLTSAPLTVL